MEENSRAYEHEYEGKRYLVRGEIDSIIASSQYDGIHLQKPFYVVLKSWNLPGRWRSRPRLDLRKLPLDQQVALRRGFKIAADCRLTSWMEFDDCKVVNATPVRASGRMTKRISFEAKDGEPKSK